MTSCAQLLRAATSLGIVLVLAGCASTVHHAAGSAKGSIGVPPDPTVTQQHRFAPAHTVPATASRSAGNCWTTSIAVPRAGVYRCLASNKILDPCYPAAPSLVACYLAPWSTPVYITLTAALPPPGVTLTGTHVWAIALAGGQRCVVVTGAVQVVGNIALTYACGSGGAAGLADTTDSLRTAFYRADAGGALQQVAVTDDWVG